MFKKSDLFSLEFDLEVIECIPITDDIEVVVFMQIVPDDGESSGCMSQSQSRYCK